MATGLQDVVERQHMHILQLRKAHQVAHGQRSGQEARLSVPFNTWTICNYQQVYGKHQESHTYTL